MSPVYIDDVVEAMAQVVMNPSLKNQTLNLCGPEKIPFVEVIDQLSKYFKVRRHKIFVPIWVAKLGVALASLFRLRSFTPDQIPRLLCKKDQDISQTDRKSVV